MSAIPQTKPAIVLLSGGLDSATTAAIAQEAGFALHAITFDYGQRHRFELAAAERVAQHLTVASHRRVNIDLRSLGTSALTSDIAVPKDRLNAATNQSPDQRSDDIPVTYVPGRNTIFLAYALAAAEVLRSTDLFIGINAIDYSGYPDCRPAYIEAFQQMANLATKSAVEGHPLTIHSPLIEWSKTQIVRKGLDLGVDFSLTHSCYDPNPDGAACRHCDACVLRQQAFAELGLPDPVLN